MYTTSTCPACRAAKEYFARKGVPYDERNVEGSPAARQEFQRASAEAACRSILVGSEKMDRLQRAAARSSCHKGFTPRFN